MNNKESITFHIPQKKSITLPDHTNTHPVIWFGYLIITGCLEKRFLTVTPFGAFSYCDNSCRGLTTNRKIKPT